jgi:hypothetical protein
MRKAAHTGGNSHRRVVAACLLAGLVAAATEAGDKLLGDSSLTPDRLAERRARLERLPRKFFVHYMGCFPVGRGAIRSHRRSAAGFLGECRQYPLVPPDIELTPRDSAELELKRAVRFGVDGFAVDTWAGGDDAKESLDWLIWVAEEKDYPVEITICADPNTLGESPRPGIKDAIRYLVDVHGDSPKLARRDGKLLVFGYQSRQLGTQSQWDELGRRRDWKGVNGALVKEFAGTVEGVRVQAQGHHLLARQIGIPVYWHFGGIPRGKRFEGLEPFEIVAQEIDAVGQFTGNADPDIGRRITAQGCEYAVPMLLQYENKIMGRSYGGPGTEVMRRRWQVAREVPATLIQFTTWNDYNENTILAPGRYLRYAFADWMSHMIRWWKTGEEPAADRDIVYIFSRDYPKGARVFPLKLMGCAEGVIEICTLLPSPATVRLPGRGENGSDAEWDVPAGMFHRAFPVTPGPIVVEIVRAGRVETRLEHPDPVTDRPCQFNGGINAFSTEFMRHWRADFGDADPAPVLRSLYRDEDGDGLPNWFEMYWFGKKGDWSTVTQAEPRRDPDRDGLTNLQEYLGQTDPTLEELKPPGSVEASDLLDDKGEDIDIDLDDF